MSRKLMSSRSAVFAGARGIVISLQKSSNNDRSMEAAIATTAAYGLGVIGLAASAVGLKARLELSKAKDRSLAGHERIARFVASLVPFYEYDETQFFKVDAAPDAVVARRRADFGRLAELYRKRYA